MNDFDESVTQKQISETESAQNEAIWQKLRHEVKAISLDLWGTILDDKHPPADTVLYSESRQNFLREELRRFGYDFSAEQMRAAHKQAWDYFNELWMKQIGFGAEEGLREMLRYLNVELPAESFQRVQKFFEEAIENPMAMDGAIEAVKMLSTKYPLALISDTAWTPGRVLRQIFASYKILDCFRVLIYSGEVGICKPHPKIFHLALEGLGVRAHECLHIGDLQRTDIAGAKAIGMHTAWIHRPVYAGNQQEDYQPSIVVKSVMEVAEKLLEGQERQLENKSVFNKIRADRVRG
ncbi:MAG: HAD family hydrolase [candidate division KSB1 bacterium]|nr:HAD family hydrolase [candidate division KSB1 bacterium]